MNTIERAAWAERLRADEGFQQLMTEFHDEAVSLFVNSSGPEAREEAHGMLRAKQKLEGILQAAKDAKTFEHKKKGQHRGND